MASPGFLIRFIDIGLIVLFGFVMISDIDRATQVELAADGPSPENVERTADRVFVTVAIAADGALSMIDENGRQLVPGTVTTAQLETALRRLKSEHAVANEEVIVLIRPHEDSVVQRTVDVMDACDRLALGKSLQMDLELRGADGTG